MGEISLGLVLGLLLLAPGLAAYAAIFHAGDVGPVRSPPPPPGSILTLTIITTGALVAHFSGALVLTLQDLACARLGNCMVIWFHPNAYAVLADFVFARRPIPTPDGLAILGTLLVVTFAAFALTRLAAGFQPIAGALRGVLYGWLNEVAVARSANEVILAHVLSDVQNDGSVVGYEGAVANLTVNAQKEITSVLLSDCILFYLLVTKHGVERIETETDEPIQQLYLDRDRIKNIAFERLRLEGA